jgi:hypothetical protein
MGQQEVLSLVSIPLEQKTEPVKKLLVMRPVILGKPSKFLGR